MAGAANSLTARPSLLPPLSHKKQRRWYKLFDDKDLAFARRISPKFPNLVGKNPDKVALVSVAFSAFELVFFDTFS